MAMLNNQMVFLNSIDVDIVIDYPIDLLYKWCWNMNPNRNARLSKFSPSFCKYSSTMVS